MVTEMVKGLCVPRRKKRKGAGKNDSYALLSSVCFIDVSSVAIVKWRHRFPGAFTASLLHPVCMTLSGKCFNHSDRVVFFFLYDTISLPVFQVAVGTPPLCP